MSDVAVQHISRIGTKDVAISILLVISVLTFVLLTTDGVVWGLYIPLLAMAAVIGFLDTALLLRGKTDFLNPSALLGLVLIPMFLIAPIKQLAWDYWPFLPSLRYSRGWIDLWAALNLMGLVAYRIALSTGIRFHRGSQRLAFESLWVPKSSRAITISIILSLVIGMAAQAYIYSRFGGLSGFVEVFTDRQEAGVREYDPFKGLGVPMILADSFKVSLAMGLIYLVRNYRFAKSSIFFASMILVLAAVFILFGGLRGSRSATLFSLFCAVGMYHLVIRKLSLKSLLVIGLFSAVFMSGYYWYKIAGANGLSAIFDPSARSSFSESRQNADRYVVVRDLGRMDMQALALREVGSDTGPSYAYGRTYLSSIFSIVPRFLIPWKPDQITKEKTEIIYGRGSYQADIPRQTTLVLGQFGEAFANFSYLGIFVFYGFLGLFVRRINRLRRELSRDDLRTYLLPAITLLPILLVITDMNVIFQQVVRYLLIPFLVVVASSRFIRITHQKPSNNFG